MLFDYVPVFRGISVQIKTSSKSMPVIAGKVIGLDDTGQIFVLCTDGVVVSYPIEEIEPNDISFYDCFPMDIEQS